MKVRKENRGGEIQTEEQESDKDEDKYIRNLRNELNIRGL